MKDQDMQMNANEQKEERSEAQQETTRQIDEALASQRGMTLVEIMIVVTIMASIMGVVGFFVFGALDRANVKKAKIEIGKLEGLVENYYLTTTPHKLPSNLDELTQGPAPLTKNVPTDPWGNDYIYQKKGNRDFEIFSAGPDGSQGTEDDITQAQNEG